MLALLATADAHAFQRTEVRAPCAYDEPDRQPFFGDLHVHTAFSFDAFVFDLRNDPWDAYAFAKGGELTLPESADHPDPTRRVRLGRPLDFAAVTDHAELLGPVRVCRDPAAAGYETANCRAIRGEEATPPPGPGRATGLAYAILDWIGQSMTAEHPTLLDSCAAPGADCVGAAASAWSETQAAAEAHYDRSAGCGFTTFVGYEYSSTPSGDNLHRNVIFRNAQVPAAPTTAIETQHDARSLWAALERDCLAPGDGCDVLTIPHNSNVSQGRMFEDPNSREEATERARFEPLVEIYQHKGSSECRFDRRFGRGVGTTDEECAFEQYGVMNLRPDAAISVSPDRFPPRAFARNALIAGLGFEQRWGVNPFRFGFVASTDAHGATAGDVDERTYEGHLGSLDSTPFQLPVNRVSLPMGANSPGGLAVLWAEENSRDALFEAMRRREAYGTSGTRPVVRFFAGDLPDDACARRDLVDLGYRQGVPMGGDLGAPTRNSKRSAPRFVVAAQADQGEPGLAGMGLDRLQIVKGWVDELGHTHEKVVDVAGGAPWATVDRATCQQRGRGFGHLCATWTDPDFDPDERALYYARVLETPSCRWSTMQCMAAGIDVFADHETCLAQARAVGLGRALFTEVCCLDETASPPIERLIRERAWTSPIWVRPDGIGALEGLVRAAPSALDSSTHATDAGDSSSTGQHVELEAEIRRLPEHLDPAAVAFRVEMAHDGAVWRAEVPAGGLTPLDASGLYRGGLVGAVGGHVEVRIRAGRPARIRVIAEEAELSFLRDGDPFVRTELTLGSWHAEHVRRWRRDGDVLRTANRAIE